MPGQIAARFHKPPFRYIITGATARQVPSEDRMALAEGKKRYALGEPFAELHQLRTFRIQHHNAVLPHAFGDQ
ncbi:hypothetical protein GCM10025857_18980 [Alicyclobacillus contaminans]|nr:hypothetical protein GCM10025857_18980 [Alicyclobacillus contaminans]